MSDDQTKEVERLGKAVWGDKDNPKEFPGLLFEVSETRRDMREVKADVAEINSSLRWITKIFLGGIALALLALVIKK